MARVTVEDCLEQIPNRFTLVLTTAERSKQLLRDDPPLVSNEDHNKEVVTALREIAAGKIIVSGADVENYRAWSPDAGPLTNPDDSALPPEHADDELPPEL